MRYAGRNGQRLESYSALNPDAADAMKRRARDLGHDLSYGPSADSFKVRLDMIRAADYGNYRKGMLGGWGIDVRDPTSDRRLIEFCLSVPTEHFRYGSVPRALVRHAMADRLPKAVLEERRKGYQTADWYERLSVARPQLAQEVERIQCSTSARRLLDVPRLRRLLQEWPESGWDSIDIISAYRYALLRGISVGHFLRKVSDAESSG
jgi:asparagine synthase (glutamine-hydrolysing)